MSKERPKVSADEVSSIRGQLQVLAEAWNLATSAASPADDAARQVRTEATRRITHEAILMLFPNYLVETRAGTLYNAQSIDVTVTVPKMRRAPGTKQRGFSVHHNDVSRAFDLLKTLGIVYEKYSFMGKDDCSALTLGVNDEP